MPRDLSNKFHDANDPHVAASREEAQRERTRYFAQLKGFLADHERELSRIQIDALRKKIGAFEKEVWRNDKKIVLITIRTVINYR